MKTIFSVAMIMLCSVHLSFGQVDTTARRLILHDHGIFTQYCLEEISKKYHVSTVATPISCFPPTVEKLDSMQNNNAMVITALARVNGNDWFQAFENDLSVCKKMLCPYDSLEQFYSLTFGSLSLQFLKDQDKLSEQHKCILKYSLIPTLRDFPNIMFELRSYSIPTDSDKSLTRAISYQDFLVSEGIDISRIKVTDKKATASLTKNAFDPINRRIELRITSF